MRPCLGLNTVLGDLLRKCFALWLETNALLLSLLRARSCGEGFTEIPKSLFTIFSHTALKMMSKY